MTDSARDCSYFEGATSACLRAVLVTFHFIESGERKFARACKQHYIEVIERIRRAGHEIVEIGPEQEDA